MPQACHRRLMYKGFAALLTLICPWGSVENQIERLINNKFFKLSTLLSFLIHLIHKHHTCVSPYIISVCAVRTKTEQFQDGVQSRSRLCEGLPVVALDALRS